jgi:hypothetical protein
MVTLGHGDHGLRRTRQRGPSCRRRPAGRRRKLGRLPTTGREWLPNGGEPNGYRYRVWKANWPPWGRGGGRSLLLQRPGRGAGHPVRDLRHRPQHRLGQRRPRHLRVVSTLTTGSPPGLVVLDLVVDVAKPGVRVRMLRAFQFSTTAPFAGGVIYLDPGGGFCNPFRNEPPLNVKTSQDLSKGDYL